MVLNTRQKTAAVSDKETEYALANVLYRFYLFHPPTKELVQIFYTYSTSAYWLPCQMAFFNGLVSIYHRKAHNTFKKVKLSVK